VLWLGGFALQRIHWTHPVGKPLTVSLLQGDIPQELKWRDDAVRWSLATYAKLTLNSTGRLIVMPETALPLFYRDVPREYLEGLAAYAKSIGSDVLIGLPEAETAGNTRYFNSVLSFGASPTQVYRKYHLVPFGEYIPLKPLFGWVIKVLNIPLADFSRGAKFQRPLRVSGQAVAVDICYEDVFGEEVIRQLPQATLLVNVSDDAWFGDSIAPWQHLQFSQTRALETGRYMLRATNTGVTAIIDQHGRVLKHMPEFKAAALNGVAQGFAGETPYVRFGNGPVLAVLFAGLALVVLRGRRVASR
ncbi:MAG TPA: apolipoprotein N-acyltransferase, partial [Betaproteobacteria bacterium]|nr:apolipoprotein N-acyltransferase [Betaproteobacteria bacterium]